MSSKPSSSSSSSFRWEAIKSLVEVLCSLEREGQAESKEEEALLKRILKLLHDTSAAAAASTSAASKDQEDRFLHVREQELVLGLAHYAAHSSSRLSLMVLPAIVPYLNSILKFSYSQHPQTSGGVGELTQMDQFAFGLGLRLLQASSLSTDAANTVLPVFLSLLKSFPEKLSSKDHDKLFTRVIPALSGLLKAVIRSSFLWNWSWLREISTVLNGLLANEILTSLDRTISLILTSEEPSLEKNCLSFYTVANSPISSSWVKLRVLECFQQVFLSHFFATAQPTFTGYEHSVRHTSENAQWDHVVKEGCNPNVSLGEDSSSFLATVQSITEKLATEEQKYLRDYAKKQKYFSDPYPLFTLGLSLRLHTLCIVATPNQGSKIFEKICEVLAVDVGSFVDEDIFLATSSLDCLALLATSQPAHIPVAAEAVKQFATRPSKVFSDRGKSADEKITTLQRAAVRSLGRMMEVDSEAHGDELKKSTMYSLSNSLYTLRTLSEQGGTTKLIAQNCIAVLGGIAAQFKSRPPVVETALSILVRRYGQLDPSLDVFIIKQVIEIGHTDDPAILKEIFELCSSIIKSSFASTQKGDDKNKIRRDGVLQGLNQIAKNMTNLPNMHEEYLLLLVNLFVNLVPTFFLDANGVPSKDISSLVGSDELNSLVALLPIIGELMNHANFNPQSTSSNTLIGTFRLLWLYIGLLGVAVDNSPKDAGKQVSATIANWSQTLYKETVSVSLKTPPITAGAALNYFDNELEAIALMKAYTQSQNPVFRRYEARLRERLSEILSSAELKLFSFSQSLYLFSVCQLETRRLIDGHGSIQHLFNYFSSEGIAKSQLMHATEKILDDIMVTYQNSLKTRPRNQDRESEIESQGQILAVLCCHQVKRVGVHAKKYLEDMVDSFPQLLWSSKFLTCILDVAGILVESCGQEPGDEMPTVVSNTHLGVLEVSLPDSLVYRQELMQTFVVLCEKWLKSAASQSPKELLARLQEFLAQTKKGSIQQLDQYGASLASQTGSASYSKVTYFGPNDPRQNYNSNGSVFVRDMLIKSRHAGEVGGMEINLANTDQDLATVFLRDLTQLLALARANPTSVTELQLKKSLFRATSLLISSEKVNFDLLHSIVWTPIKIFTPLALRVGTTAWSWIVASRPEVDLRLMTEIVSAWDWSIRAEVGLFNLKGHHQQNILYQRMKYSPPTPLGKPNPDLQEENAHLVVISWLSDRLKVVSLKSQEHIKIYMKMLSKALDNATLSVRASARAALFKLLSLGMHLIQGHHLSDELKIFFLKERIYLSALTWFIHDSTWTEGDTRALTEEIKVVAEFYDLLLSDKQTVLTIASQEDLFATSDSVRGPSASSGKPINLDVTNARDLLLLLVGSELERLTSWHNPLHMKTKVVVDEGKFVGVDQSMKETKWRKLVNFAWGTSPLLAVRLSERFPSDGIKTELRELLKTKTLSAVNIPEALHFLLTEENLKNDIPQLKYVLLWKAVPPMTALTLFMNKFQNHPIVVQYAHRVMLDFPAENLLFYAPQIVQTLRYDKRGLVAKFIINAARSKSSQLLCHQLIWNMRANMYLDAESTKEDVLKPVLEHIIQSLINSFEGESKKYFDEEFEFFRIVTGISGSLKPLIKKPKEEKKKKIDEELAKVQVVHGVYLPSSPESVVVDIDYKSGRPLQSHAKAPFMATFKVIPASATPAPSQNSKDREKEKEKAVWKACIFKVGDDCRQDVLALQLIALFQNIFTSVGLDLYTFPYRVVATDPGCGVIEVVPGTISRDILGREKINSFYTYFLNKYGNEDSPQFQKARDNFVKSMAAYSVVVYILSLRDRHNGNVMIDDEGHIIHIDFGFILGISPGGVVFNDILKAGFETSPFLLKKEMVQIMGGSVDSEPFRWFSELVVRGFLAARPFYKQIIQLVALMIDSNLPCFFRGEETITRLRERLQPDLSERKAAEFMMDKIKKSHDNPRTTAYDMFQKMQNDIPY